MSHPKYTVNGIETDSLETLMQSVFGDCPALRRETVLIAMKPAKERITYLEEKCAALDKIIENYRSIFQELCNKLEQAEQ